MVAANITIDERIYSIQFTPAGIRVVGGNRQMCETIRALCNGALAEYSPTYGSLAAYVAGYAVRRLLGKIVTVEEPASPQGLVY